MARIQLLFPIIKMSGLIDQLIFKQKNSSLEDSPFVFKKNKFLSTLVDRLRSLSDRHHFELRKQSNQFIAILECLPLYLGYTYLCEVVYHEAKKTIRYNNILLAQGKPFTINLHSLRTTGILLLNETHRLIPEIKITINQKNGLIQIKNSVIIGEELAWLSIQGVLNIITKTINILFKRKDQIQKIFQNISNQYSFDKVSKLQNNQMYINKNIGKILKYMKISFMELDISQVQVEQTKRLGCMELQERVNFSMHKSLNISDFQISKTLSIFQVFEPQNGDVETMISQQQIFEISPFLKIPKPRLSNISENEFIFNDVFIKNLQNINIKNTNISGGTGQFLITKLQFQYLIDEKILKLNQQKYFNKPMRQNQKPSLEKLVLIKNPVKKQCSQYIQHEMNILQTIRYSSSGYLVKYYKTSQDCFMKNKLMMDYLLGYVDLNTYLENHHSTMSIITRIALLSNIANALRFLNSHKIVHMDLTPRNILVGPNLLTKIIDFGQAYSIRLAKIADGKYNYKPGFTNPYGPPEVFGPKNFTVKQDVFSFGIILFKTLFGNLPFEPTQKLKLTYKDKSYNQKLYLCIQSLNYTWMEAPIILLLSIFIRCKSVDPLARPYPTWLRVLLKLIIQWFKNIFNE